MHLVSIRLCCVGPFDDVTLRLASEAGVPRPVTVLFGGDGTGKTSLLHALASTRPGNTLSPAMSAREQREGPSFAVTEWLLGNDDPERPHSLVVASPAAVLADETPEAALSRKREQSIFDRRAQVEGGFVFLSFSGARWFSRAPNMLSSPNKSVLRYDPKQPASFDDPTRADLARETKQIVSYAAIGRALGEGLAESIHLTRFDDALRTVLAIVLEPFGLRYAGVSPETLEPEVIDAGNRRLSFDAIPRPARHLMAFGAFTVRALAAAYPGSDAPNEAEGVVAIDDFESQQTPSILHSSLPLLTRALPNVQWIVATASTALAMAVGTDEVVTLRASAGGRSIAIDEGVLH